MYLTVNEYAKKYGITYQAVHKRIKKGHISKDRIKKNDAGRIVIKDVELNG